MPRSSARRLPDTAPLGGDELQRLLQAEQHLEALVQRAREEARELLRRAREQAAAVERAEQRTLATALRQLEQRIATETERAAAEIRAAAVRDVARYADVSEPRIAALAGKLVERLLASEDEP